MCVVKDAWWVVLCYGGRWPKQTNGLLGLRSDPLWAAGAPLVRLGKVSLKSFCSAVPLTEGWGAPGVPASSLPSLCDLIHLSLKVFSLPDCSVLRSCCWRPSHPPLRATGGKGRSERFSLRRPGPHQCLCPCFFPSPTFSVYLMYETP